MFEPKDSFHSDHNLFGQLYMNVDTRMEQITTPMQVNSLTAGTDY